tara:strand:- start:107 stop:415 length:309 start_codon:yes stop_codon:yes gene_type:complete
MSFIEHDVKLVDSYDPSISDILWIIKISKIFHVIVGILGLGLYKYSHGLYLLHSTIDLMGTQRKSLDRFAEEIFRKLNKSHSVVPDNIEGSGDSFNISGFVR